MDGGDHGLVVIQLDSVRLKKRRFHPEATDLPRW